MVTSADSPNEWIEANPDVINVSDVTRCELEIDEEKTEIMRKDKDGKEVSYQPPRYHYSYDFYIQLYVRNPYFDDIRFKLNNSCVELENLNPQKLYQSGAISPSSPSAYKYKEYTYYKTMGEEVKAALLTPAPIANTKQPNPQPATTEQTEKNEPVATPAAAAVSTCPTCGAPVPPGASVCEFCDSRIK